MKLYIKDYCIRCGLCEDMHPEIFHLDTEKDVIEIKCDVIPTEMEDAARDAIKNCAIAAIFVER